MKRLIALFLLVVLCLTACAPAYEIPYNSTEGTTETTEMNTVETTEETEAKVLYRHPLTGEPLEEPLTARPTAVVINNIKACMPQHGISQADIMYEIETEGGITRCLALFTDLSGVDKIGPIRSCRTYFNHLSATYDAPLVHCGGSVNGLKGYYDLNNKLSKWTHLDQRYNGDYFYRDKDRKASGYAKEHTLFTTGELLQKGFEKKKIDMVYDAPVDYGFIFEDAPVMTGETANKVTVKFYGKKTTTMTYNTTSGLYEAAQYNKDHIDGETGEVLTYRNVLVLQTKHWKEKEGSYSRSYYNLTGSGNGYFACDGKIVPIKWKHNKVTDNFTYTLEDGTPLVLGVGRSYVGIISTSGSVTAE